MKWAVLRLVWWVKGQKIEVVAEELQKAFPNRKDKDGQGLSYSAIQRASETAEDAPDDVAAFICQKLEVQPGHEAMWDVVRHGLVALGQGGLAIDPVALASELAARLPQVDPDVLATAIAAKLPTVDPDALARAIASQLPQVDSEALARAVTAMVTAQVSDVSRKSASAVADTVPRPEAIARAVVRQLAPWLSGIGLLIVGLFVIQCRHVSTGAGIFDPLQLSDVGITGSMGERRAAPPVPHKPVPNQAVAPCRGSATDLYGSCWLLTGFKAPCPSDLYQDGDKCYVPVAVDPRQPVGEPPQRSTSQQPSEGLPDERNIPGTCRP